MSDLYGKCGETAMLNAPLKYEHMMWTGIGYDICAECGEQCQETLRVTFGDVCFHLCPDCVETLQEHLAALEATLETGQ